MSNRNGQLDYEFVLNIQPHLSFWGKYAQLGGDQKEALIRVGTRPGEDVYLFMCPDSVFEDVTLALPPPGFNTGSSTRLSEKYTRIMMTFIAYCLSQMRDATGIYCNIPDGIPMPPEPMNWSFTNA